MSQKSSYHTKSSARSTWHIRVNTNSLSGGTGVDLKNRPQFRTLVSRAQELCRNFNGNSCRLKKTTRFGLNDSRNTGIVDFRPFLGERD